VHWDRQQVLTITAVRDKNSGIRKAAGARKIEKNSGFTRIKSEKVPRESPGEPPDKQRPEGRGKRQVLNSLRREKGRQGGEKDVARRRQGRQKKLMKGRGRPPVTDRFGEEIQRV